MERFSIDHLAKGFWAAAGGPEPFPRQLEAAVLWALPVAIFKLPRLCVSEVQGWLVDRGIGFRLETGNRPLHGCLVAHSGRGCVLLNGTDSGPELRFSLAHEVAHFVLDYLRPRQEAVTRLGAEILEVFDGRRPPTVQERVHAVLNHAAIGFHTHLMDRDGSGCGLVAEMEDSADHLALELLAPRGDVRQRVARAHAETSNPEINEVAIKVLKEEFGLPTHVAARYVHFYYPNVTTFSVRRWLRQRSD